MTATPAGTEEEAANLALDQLREEAIALLTDQNKRARAANKWFGTVRDELLREHDWNFSTGWDRPAADATDGIGTLKKRYPMPSDCVRVRFVDNLEADQWAVENSKVTIAAAEVEQVIMVCNVLNPLVCYSRRVANVKLWDAEFVIAFARRLAAYMAPSFGKTYSEADAIEAGAARRVDKAAMRDAREKAPTIMPRDTSWTRARSRFPGR